MHRDFYVEAVKLKGKFVVFAMDGQRLALPVSEVERVVRAVEITPLPSAPEVVMGVINHQGRILPVFDLRRRLRMLEREIDPDDHILIARTQRCSVALVVDSVTGVVESGEEGAIPTEELTAGVEQIEGVLKRPDGLIFIHDLSKFLSPQEAGQLEGALAS